MAAAWFWIKRLFSASGVGMLFAAMAKHAASAAVSQIMDPENQRKAYEFVKELRFRTDMSNLEKAEAFNLKMLVWAEKVGRIMADSAINCLRELAVSALKAELGRKWPVVEACDR